MRQPTILKKILKNLSSEAFHATNIHYKQPGLRTGNRQTECEKLNLLVYWGEGGGQRERLCTWEPDGYLGQGKARPDHLHQKPGRVGQPQRGRWKNMEEKSEVTLPALAKWF